MEQKLFSALPSAYRRGNMRPTTSILILVAGLALSFGAWALSGGRIWFLFLPLLLAYPLAWRRKG